MSRRFLLMTFCALCASCTISTAQTASYTASDTTGCVPFTVNFTNTSIGATTYFWDFDDGLTTSLANPTHIFYGTGSYTVMLYAYDSLLNIDSFSVVIEVPSSLPFFNLPSIACPDQSIQFSVFGNYDPDNMVMWDFGDGSLGNNSLVEHAFLDTGTYTIVLTVTNSACGVSQDSSTIVITETLLPTIHIHPEIATTTICPGENFPFFYDENYGIEWDFGTGDSSTDPYPIFSYDSVGIYTASVTVTNECGNSNSLDTLITVSNSTPANALAFGPTLTCKNDSASFTGSIGFGYSYEWNFGTGGTDTNRVSKYAFSDTGTYTVQLIVTNLCGQKDTALIEVIVTDTLVPTGWMSIVNATACPNEAITFLAPNGHSTYVWDFGDGNSDLIQKPIHQYSTPGTYAVTLTLSNSCGSTTYSDTVTIDAGLSTTASFTAAQLNYCMGDEVSFTGNGYGNITSHYWDFGDGNEDSLQNTTHQYPDTGLYNVTYVITNLCGINDTGTLTIRVDTSSAPVSSFASSSGNYTCPNTEIAFTNLSSNTDSVIWDFGDGNISLLINPVHSFTAPGNYVVRLSATNSCGQSSISTSIITISNFTQLAPPAISCSQVGDSIVFTWPTILHATGYEISTDDGVSWNPINGGLSSYTIPGIPDSTYTAQVKAIGNGNCTSTASTSVSCTYIEVGVEQLDPESILAITPNPSAGIFQVRFSSPIQPNDMLYVTNILGEIIHTSMVSEMMYSVDISDQPAGIYLFWYRSKYIIESQRVVVGH